MFQRSFGSFGGGFRKKSTASSDKFQDTCLVRMPPRRWPCSEGEPNKKKTVAKTPSNSPWKLNGLSVGKLYGLNGLSTKWFFFFLGKRPVFFKMGTPGWFPLKVFPPNTYPLIVAAPLLAPGSMGEFSFHGQDWGTHVNRYTQRSLMKLATQHLNKNGDLTRKES